MSSRYYNATVKAIAAAGGHTGRVTMLALRPRMLELHTLGLKSVAAGNVLAREYQLHSSLQGWRELSDGK